MAWRGGLPFVLLGLALFGVGVSAWHPMPAGVWHDDGVYMLVGKALAEGHGLVYQGVAGTPPATKFPPLYPGVLGLLWLVFGTIGPVTLVATYLNLALLAVAGGLLAKSLHDSTDLSMPAAVAAAGLGFASADLVRTALLPLSESLYLCLAMCALFLWRDAASGARRSQLGMAVVLVLAIATRSAAVALVLAVAVAFSTRRAWRTAGFVAGPALVVMGAWSLWSSAQSARIPEGARDVLGPYGGWLVGQVLTAPADFVTRLPVHALGLGDRVTAVFAPGLAGWWLALVAIPLITFCGVGLRQLLRRFPPLAWLIVFYVLMLLFWPYLDRRLVAPLHPTIVAVAAVGFAAVYGGARTRSSQKLLGALAFAWVAGYSIVTASRISGGWPVAPYQIRAEYLANGVEALGNTVGPDAVIGAPELWPALHLHGGWTVSPSARFDPASVDPAAPVWGTPAEQIELWREMGVDHLLLELAGTMHGPALDQIEAACPGTVFVLARMPQLMVIQLDWSTECPLLGSA